MTKLVHCLLLRLTGDIQHLLVLVSACRSPSFAGSDSEGSSKSNPRCKAAEAGSPGEISPLQPRRLSSSPSRADATGTPAQVGSSPNLAVTSGSVYSTPTLALGASAGYSQVGEGVQNVVQLSAEGLALHY